MENSLFGPTTTTAGLLVGADIRRALADRHDLDLALIPAETINDDGLFLDDERFIALRETLPMPVFPSYDFIDVLAFEGEPHLSGRARMSVPVVALIGRPNVGKSALFNRIVGDDTAIVSEEAGTTRDRHFSRAEWNGRAFWLVDTGGLSDDPQAPMDREIRRQVATGGRGGGHRCCSSSTRRSACIRATPRSPRCCAERESRGCSSRTRWTIRAASTIYDFYQLGAGDPFPVSAQNGKNSGDLLDALVERLPESAPEDEEALRVAVVGRPNVGKSSFVNRLLGEERLVVSEIAGTTRDAIDTPMTYHGRKLVFVDTAGLRRQTKIDDGIEFYSSLRTRRAIERANICVLLVDATEGELHHQDLRIAQRRVGGGARADRRRQQVGSRREGRQGDAQVREEGAREGALPQLRALSLHVGAHRPARHEDPRPHPARRRGAAASASPTSQVNERLAELLARRQPSQAAGREVKLNYATQVSVQPPTIAVFGNHPDLVEEHYVRFLHNGFRETWRLHRQSAAHRCMRRKSGASGRD